MFNTLVTCLTELSLLPRIDQLWYKYVYLEELLQNVPGARQVFERWMAWEPDDKAWQAYIKLEELQEVAQAQAVFAAFAKMETRLKEYDRARVIYK
ncbi:Crooked neck-like protein 1, partial [Ceratobasidium sp. 414]